MEKILILADFDAGALFLKELKNASKASAIIISADERMFSPVSTLAQNAVYAPSSSFKAPLRVLEPSLCGAGFSGYFADPCNQEKIAEFLNDELGIVYILLSDERSIRLAYDGVRKVLSNITIVVVSNDVSYANDAFCSAFSPRAMVAARLIDELPFTPHIARYIGMGAGEIMQVKVPAGSMYANKHLRAITQKDYKIAMIYRKGEAILARAQLIIEPGDELLLVGSAQRLRKIFDRVRAMVGQFPHPYASKIAVIIDMKIEKQAKELIYAALRLLDKTSATHCEIYAFNVRPIDDLELLKSLRTSENIKISLIYQQKSEEQIILELAEQANYLFLCSQEGFSRNKMAFFETSMPILRLGKQEFSAIDHICALSQNGSGVEELTGILLDISVLLDIKSSIYLYETELSRKRLLELHEHIDQQSKFFNKKLNLNVFKKSNPLFALQSEKNTICVSGFSEKFAKSSVLDKLFLRFFRPALEDNLQALSENHMLFVPIT